MSKSIKVEIDGQRLIALEGIREVYRYHCVSGDNNHKTPLGLFKIIRKHRVYRSKKYNSQMNFAMFFNGGVAIHESNLVFAMSHLRTLFQTIGAQGNDPWGSHGCVRLSSDDAKSLFDWAPLGTVVEVKA